MGLYLNVKGDFFISCFATPKPTWGHWRGGSLTHPILNTKYFLISPEGHQELHNEVGSQSPVDCIDWIWAWSLPIMRDVLSPCVTFLNPLMHNVPKWSHTLKSCSKCCKILKLCLTILGHYALNGLDMWLVVIRSR